MKIGINGFGRIGRLTLRAFIERKGTEGLALINSPGDIETLCHLYNYDSVHGRADFPAKIEDNALIIKNKKIAISHEKEPKNIPWKEYGVNLVLECSGKFTNKEKASGHLSSGAKKIIISAPSEDADKIIIIGINHKNITKNDNIISIGSCTTNAFIPIAKIINDNFGIEAGYITTIHSYTGDQNIVDNSHKDLRRARSAFMSMIPTKTGAASSISLILPELKGKIDGSAIRVPTSNVSMIDFTFMSKKNLSLQAINDVMINASNGYLKNIIGIAEAKLVSIDFNHSIYSSIYDPFETKIVNENFARIVAWYDNEWAFANRMVDCLNLFSSSYYGN